MVFPRVLLVNVCFSLVDMETRKTLRIATLNVHAWKDDFHKSNPKSIETIINDEKIDIVRTIKSK
jgi:hypothetical protein